MPGKNDGDAELTTQTVVAEVDRKMDQSIEALKRDLNTLRSGRATPSLIENVPVESITSNRMLRASK